MNLRIIITGQKCFFCAELMEAMKRRYPHVKSEYYEFEEIVKYLDKVPATDNNHVMVICGKEFDKQQISHFVRLKHSASNIPALFIAEHCDFKNTLRILKTGYRGYIGAGLKVATALQAVEKLIHLWDNEKIINESTL